MNKKISFALVIIIIIVCAVLTGLIIWQYGIFSEISWGNIPFLKSEIICGKTATSMLNIEKCIGKKIEAIGILECVKSGVPSKAGIHYLRFEDGTDLKFLEGYQNCQSYDGKKIKVIGELYRCGERDQCAGVGLINIESVNLIEEVITIATNKAEYKQGEIIKITATNNLDKSVWYIGNLQEEFPWWKLVKNKDGNLEEVDILKPLTEEGKKECILRLFERVPIEDLIVELKPGTEIIDEWDFENCQQIETSAGLELKFIEPGTYRFSFNYTQDKETYSTEKYKEEITTIYSNEFTITVKERELTKTWKDWASIKSKEECESYGGRWHTWSFWQAGKEGCDMLYPDGGKICNDPSDCVGNLCLHSGENPAINTFASGECAGWINISCVNHNYFIENGKIIKNLCVE